MKIISSALIVLSALASANGGPVHFKRGLPNYSASTASPIYASVGSGQPSYTKAFRPAPELRAAPAAQYVAQSAPSYSSPSAQQYYQQVEPQAVAYSQPQPVAKYASASGVQKYALQPQAQPQQYSSAADVSSFSYSSPVVSYNNLGFLHQIIGKGAAAQQPQQQQQVYSSAPSPKVQYASSPAQYTSAQNYEVPNTYQAVAQKAAYSEPSQAQYQAQAYAQAQAQAQALAEAQAQAKAQSQSQSQQSQPHAITFQTSSPAAQKFAYSAAPSYQAIQGLQKQSAQVNYVSSPQYTVSQASPQAYEAAAHSAPQVSYSQPAAQPQYYSVPQGAKYLRGITYAQ